MSIGRCISASRQRLFLALLSKQRLPIRGLSTTFQRCAGQRGQRDDGPIQFSNSKAASWSMTNSVIVPTREAPWYQTFSVCVSIATFLVYFLVLREENDLDFELNYSLFERVPQLEEHQVKLAIDYFRRQGDDTQDLEKRLAEIQQEKKALIQST